MQNQNFDAKMRERLLRLMMSALDFRHSLSAATFLLEDCDWSKPQRIEELRRLKCFETTMVVAYGRPFTQARGHTAPFRWNQIKPGFQMEPSEATIHGKLINYRNKLHAHSDGDFTQIAPEIWRTRLPNGEDFDFLAVRRGENLVFTEHEAQVIHTFLWKVRHHIDDAIQSHPGPRDHIPVVIRDVFGGGVEKAAVATDHSRPS